MMKLSRRDVLRLTGISASALLLGACLGESENATATPPTATESRTAAPTEPTPAESWTAAPSPSPVQFTPTPRATSVPREMILVEASSFLMGSEDGYPNERPVHLVNITRPFYMSVYMVTLDQYDTFCTRTVRKPSDDHGWGRGNRPAISLTWIEATAYCNWLSEMEGLECSYSGVGKNTACDFTASGYRLPTEAEWEFAARGGTHSSGFRYPGSDDPLEVAWHDANSNGMTHPVGQLKPNELGIFDMAGNGGEWCWDWYAPDYYARSPNNDPAGLPREELPKDDFLQVKAKRGGFINASAENIYCTFRSFDNLDWPGGCIRLVRTAT